MAGRWLVCWAARVARLFHSIFCLPGPVSLASYVCLPSSVHVPYQAMTLKFTICWSVMKHKKTDIFTKPWKIQGVTWQLISSDEKKPLTMRRLPRVSFIIRHDCHRCLYEPVAWYWLGWRESPLAQSVEHWSRKPKDPSSNPSGCNTIFHNCICICDMFMYALFVFEDGYVVFFKLLHIRYQ